MVIMAAGLAILISLNANKDHQILELKIHSKNYKRLDSIRVAKYELAEDSLTDLRKELAAIEKQLQNIQTDEEVISSNPVVHVSTDDPWEAVISAIEHAVSDSGR